MFLLQFVFAFSPDDSRSLEVKEGGMLTVTDGTKSNAIDNQSTESLRTAF